MKYIKQIIIILLASFIGEFLNFYIPLPIPSGIYGMLILLILLCTNLLDLNQVEDVGTFLIDIMPILFIPSAVGIISQAEILKNIWIEIAIITVVTTIIVMVITGHITQLLIRFITKRKERERKDRK